MNSHRTVAMPARRAGGSRRARGAWRACGAALLAALPLAAAACSPGAPGPQVASLPGHHRQGHGPGTLTTARSDRDMISFARCMRARGVQISDPVHIPGHAGLSINLPSHAAANDAAYKACDHILQPIIQMKQAGAAAAAAPHMAALTQYAQCMRAHDIAMLDPTSFGALNLGRVPGITGNFGRYSPQFRAADRACRHFLPARVHDNGTGP
jgi:hypothetical protein